MERHIEILRKNISKKLNCDVFDDEIQSIKGSLENLTNGGKQAIQTSVLTVNSPS